MRMVHAKGYRILLVLIAVLVLLALGIAIKYDMDRSGLAVQAPGNTPAPAAASYLLKEYEGKIGIFHIGDTAPFRVLEVYLVSLPVIDRTELEDGIFVSGDAKLQVMIEDYES